MNRRVTNAIRYVMDEWIPAAVRDSRWFMYPFFWYAYRGKNIAQAMDFKRLVVAMSREDYAGYYAGLDSISRNRQTDLNDACLRAILAAIPDGRPRVLDVGCGGGFLLRKIAAAKPGAQLTGLDVKEPPGGLPGEFIHGFADAIPAPDQSFDLVLATHTLEHCTDLPAAVREIRRVARGPVIVVVPKQRPFYYTLDEHLHFFFYREQLVAAMGMNVLECRELDGDWYYVGRA